MTVWTVDFVPNQRSQSIGQTYVCYKINIFLFFQIYWIKTGFTYYWENIQCWIGSKKKPFFTEQLFNALEQT